MIEGSGVRVKKPQNQLTGISKDFKHFDFEFVSNLPARLNKFKLGCFGFRLYHLGI
jgi:hypothetical protein